MKSFKFDDKIKNVNIDVSEAHFWDLSAVAALDRVVDKYRKKNIITNVIGLNLASKTIVTKLSEVEKKNLDII